MSGYVHGYSRQEATRLTDQADTLARLLHSGTCFPAGTRVLECGCGTGAQTIHLAQNSPEARILSLDISQKSLDLAREKIRRRGIRNVRFLQGDLFDLPVEPASFDHAFVCFVLEHLPRPARALDRVKRALKPGGSITVIEGDHGSWYCHPETALARKTVDCLIRAQAGLGGDSLIGRRLFPLLKESGFQQVRVEPKMVYVDSSRPQWVEGFSKNTFIAMVRAVEQTAVEKRWMSQADWDRGIADMMRATEGDGTFCYTFFKARGKKEKSIEKQYR